jgi:hypothetical protein
VSVTRTFLVDAAGIAPDRLGRDAGSRALGATGQGRVEFELEAAS